MTYTQQATDILREEYDPNHVMSIFHKENYREIVQVLRRITYNRSLQKLNNALMLDSAAFVIARDAIQNLVHEINK